MNLVHNFLLNQYIQSPKTWLHKLKSSSKTYFLFIYLYTILYTHEKYIIVSICLHFMLILYIKNINNNYNKLLPHILYIFSILIYIMIILIESSFNMIIIRLLYIYYFFIFVLNKYLLQLRPFLILIHYFFTLKIIFLTTTYEDITFSFFKLFEIYKNNTINQIIFISIFASQALESIILKIQYILLTIKIKKVTKLFKFKCYIYLYLISKFIQDIYNNTYIISSVLYTKEFNNNCIYYLYL
uniref:Ycf92 n=1 Tax=Gracilaria firma TaxID=2510791 RepID=A0A2Z2JIP3_9FLOR|nr:Ycf92 [Gracilaria changii]ART65210.1 Ycf92 [Gracilaria changii]